MKRISFTILLCLCAIASVCAQPKYVRDAMEFSAVNDSILSEAYQLYIHEKLAWLFEDKYIESCPSTTICDGWVPITEDGVVVKGVFFNLKDSLAVFETSVNIQTGIVSVTDSSRVLTPNEQKAIQVRLTVINAVQFLDSIPTCPDGCTFNVNVVQLEDNLYRVYWMLGTPQNNIIPFGCDFSYDCDSDGRVKAFRQYHLTYVPAPLMMNGEPVREIWHSHTSICPFISPTDIALFLLYGYERSGISKLSVYSTALKTTFTFDAEQFKIMSKNSKMVSM